MGTLWISSPDEFFLKRKQLMDMVWYLDRSVNCLVNQATCLLVLTCLVIGCLTAALLGYWLPLLRIGFGWFGLLFLNFYKLAVDAKFWCLHQTWVS